MIRKKWMFLGMSLFLFQIALGGEIQIMSYNVENLFDAKQDIDSKTGVDKIDWEFLPAQHPSRLKGCAEKQKKFDQKCKKRQSCLEENKKHYTKCIADDWNEDKVQIKIKQIKQMVLDSRANLPDMLALQEVENDQVVNSLAKELGFTSLAITDSPDIRGIDVALLFNETKGLSWIETKEYTLQGKRFQDFPTRNLLEVSFLIDMQHKLFVYVNHWPSQAAPSDVRGQVAAQLLEKIKIRQEAYPEASFILMGDFNVIAGEQPDPFQDVLLNPSKASLLFMDAHEEFLKMSSISDDKKNLLLEGTYYYGKDQVWNRFDRFFYSPNLSLSGKGLRIDIPSYEIYAPDFAKTKTGTPIRYNHFGPNSYNNPGYSDHFPIGVRLQY